MTTRVPRTLHLTVHESGGGTEANVARLCDAVPEFQHMALETTMGMPLRWSRIGAAIAELRAAQPEVLFCYGISAHLVALAARLKHTTLVGNIRSEVDFAGRKAMIWKLVERRFVTWISNSRAAIEKIPRRPHSYSIIYNGIPPATATAGYVPRHDPPVLVMLARGHASKGHRFVLELWRDLQKPGTLVFAGKLEPQLKRDAEQEGVLCPGFVEPGTVLADADLLLIASDVEGIPTALLDAMMRGVPALATPVGGIPEIITHGSNGFLLPRGEWRKFLADLNMDELKAVGGRAKEYATQHATFERMKNEFIFAAIRAAANPS